MEISYLEVTAAQMETNGHVARSSLETVVVGLNVRIQERLVVNALLFHTLDHRVCAKVCK